MFSEENPSAGRHTSAIVHDAKELPSGDERRVGDVLPVRPGATRSIRRNDPFRRNTVRIRQIYPFRPSSLGANILINASRTLGDLESRLRPFGSEGSVLITSRSLVHRVALEHSVDPPGLDSGR